MPAQLELARFYLARDMISEAKGVLDVAASNERAAQDGTALVLRAVANIMLGRGADALKDLSGAAVAKRDDLALWRALAQAKEGKWVEAREGFRALDSATATLPVELQAMPSRRRCARPWRCATSARPPACFPNSRRSGRHASATPT